MAKYILIDKGDGYVVAVRSILETTSEEPLTDQEIIINQLVKRLSNIPSSEEIKDKSYDHKVADKWDMRNEAYWEGHEDGFLKGANWVVEKLPSEEKKFRFEEVVILLKAFHLDSVQGRYNKELLDWCNEWIERNINEVYNIPYKL
jgi:hypothetical protein